MIAALPSSPLRYCRCIESARPVLQRPTHPPAASARSSNTGDDLRSRLLSFSVATRPWSARGQWPLALQSMSGAWGLSASLPSDCRPGLVQQARAENFLLGLLKRSEVAIQSLSRHMKTLTVSSVLGWPGRGRKSSDFLVKRQETVL